MKRWKKIVELLLAVALVVGMLPTMTVKAEESHYSDSYKSGVYYQRLKNVQIGNSDIENMINIALSQVGYHAGSSDKDLKGDGTSELKYTEYGRWANKQDDWCAIFLSWCANEAGILDSAINMLIGTPKDVYIKSRTYDAKNGKGVYHSVAESFVGTSATYPDRETPTYIPRKGDIFTTIGHTGICTGDYNPSTKSIAVVHGNWGNKVTTGTINCDGNGNYKLDNNTYPIIAFLTPEYNDYDGIIRTNLTDNSEVTVTAEGLNVKWSSVKDATAYCVRIRDLTDNPDGDKSDGQYYVFKKDLSDPSHPEFTIRHLMWDNINGNDPHNNGPFQDGHQYRVWVGALDDYGNSIAASEAVTITVHYKKFVIMHGEEEMIPGNSYEMFNGYGEMNLQISSVCSWQIASYTGSAPTQEDADWFSVSPVRGEAGTTNVKISIPNGITDGKRVGTIQFTTSDGGEYILYLYQGVEETTPDLPISEGLEYAEYDDYCVVTGPGTYTGENLVIPSTHNGKPVTSIGYNAFGWCEGFTGSLVIPDSVTSIGDRAFYNCSGFTGSLVIPDSVTSIGDYAFYYCGGFTGSLVIPDSVTSIGESTFGWCEGFSGNLVIPESVTSISDYAFNCCKGFTGSLIIPNSVTSIGSYAFGGCSNLTGVTIPSSVTSIDDSTFYNCTSLTSITIPSSVTSIGSFAFAMCTNLKSVMISEGVTSVGRNAFWYCDELTSVTIPDSVTSIGEYAFDGCDKLTTAGPIGSGSNIEFGWTKTIPSSAFKYNESLTSVTIPDSVTSIGDWAFLRCSNLMSVTLPDSMTHTGYFAFCDCDKLKTAGPIGSGSNIEFGWTKMICFTAFYGFFNLTSVTIPDSMKIIIDLNFGDCTSLTDIYFLGNAPSFSTSAFQGITATVHYPANVPTWTADVKQNYGGTLTWVPYTSDYIITPTVKEDGTAEVTITEDAFKKQIKNTKGSVKIEAGEDVTSIVLPDYIVTSVSESSTVDSISIRTGSNSIDMDTGVIRTTAKKLNSGSKLSVGIEQKDTASLDPAVQEELNRISEDAVVFDLSMTVRNGGAEDETLHQLGGTVTVRIPYDKPEGKNTVPVVRYLASNGETVFVRAGYEGNCIVFETDHFSEFALAMVDAYSGNIGSASFYYDAVDQTISLSGASEEGTVYAAFYDEHGKMIAFSETAQTGTAIPNGTDVIRLFVLSDTYCPSAKSVLLYACNAI